MFVIHKKSRNASAAGSYDGPTWDVARIRHLYKTFYKDRLEAEEIATILTESNPVGFTVSDVSEHPCACALCVEGHKPVLTQGLTALDDLSAQVLAKSVKSR